MARQIDFIRKPEPAVMEIEFNLPPGVSYLDINQVLSLLNRKFLRQGMQIPVQSMEVQFEPVPLADYARGTVVISKLPTTWIFANAWNKGYQGWKRMNSIALSETESVAPKFLDFKIYADEDHHQLGYDANIMPTSPLPNKGMWEASKYQIPDSTSPVGLASAREVLGTGANYPGAGASGHDAVSLIEGYAASRALPDIEDPNTPDDMHSADGLTPQNWLQAIFNEGTEQTGEILDDMSVDNNLAPYPFENGEIHNFPGTYWTDTMYPNGANQTPGLAFHDKLLITSTTIGGSDTAIGGVFPCGLVKFDTTIEDGTATLILRLVPGEHRGYMQEPMQEMNRQ